MLYSLLDICFHTIFMGQLGDNYVIVSSETPCVSHAFAKMHALVYSPGTFLSGYS